MSPVLGDLISHLRGVAVSQEEAESLADILGLTVGQFPDRPDDLMQVILKIAVPLIRSKCNRINSCHL